MRALDVSQEDMRARVIARLECQVEDEFQRDDGVSKRRVVLLIEVLEKVKNLKRGERL